MSHNRTVARKGTRESRVVRLAEVPLVEGRENTTLVLDVMNGREEGFARP